MGQFCTSLTFFSYFLFLVPLIGVLENTLFDLATLKSSSTLKIPPPFAIRYSP
jgi:hypothetical protein